MRGLAERVWPRCPAAPSRRSIPLDAFEGVGRRPLYPLWARLWAGPFCSSRRPSRSASHESGREGWKRAGRVSWLAAHCAPRRGGVSAACARFLAAFWPLWVFGVFLRVRAFVLQTAWRGVAVGCLVWFWRCFRTRKQIIDPGWCFRTRKQIIDPGCTGQIGKLAGQMDSLRVS